MTRLILDDPGYDPEAARRWLEDNWELENALVVPCQDLSGAVLFGPE